MTYVHRIPSELWVAVIAGFALAAAATVASAGTSTVNGPSAAASSGTGSAFTLDKAANAQVLDYPTSRELRICNQTHRTTPSGIAWNLANHWVTPSPLIRISQEATEQGSAQAAPQRLAVSSDTGSAEIQPGECYRLHARRVRIAAVGPIPAGSALNGSIQWVSATSAPRANGGVAYAGAAPAASVQAMIADMQGSLRESDRTIREATAKLHQARRDLDSATDKLNQVAATRVENGKTVHEASAAHAGNAR